MTSSVSSDGVDSSVRLTQVPNRKSIPRDLRRRMLEDPSCYYCDTEESEEGWEIDHLVPVAEGGETVESNLVVACWRCNRGKSSKDESRSDEWVSAGDKELRDIMNRTLGRKRC